MVSLPPSGFCLKAGRVSGSSIGKTGFTLFFTISLGGARGAPGFGGFLVGLVHYTDAIVEKTCTACTGKWMTRAVGPGIISGPQVCSVRS